MNELLERSISGFVGYVFVVIGMYHGDFQFIFTTISAVETLNAIILGLIGGGTAVFSKDVYNWAKSQIQKRFGNKKDQE